jgi:hypothetical protein
MTSVLSSTVLGNADFPGGTQWSLKFFLLPNGNIFAVESVGLPGSPPQSIVKVLAPTASSIADITGIATSGALPTDIGTSSPLGGVYVGSNTLPDIFVVDGGTDGTNVSDPGGLVRVFAPVNGLYADETSLLPQLPAWNHRLAVGLIDGQNVVAVARPAFVTGAHVAPPGIAVFVANSDGTFSDWSSHLPADFAAFPSALRGGFASATIADITGSGAGDLFLGGENNWDNQSIPDVTLVNDGQGNFHAVTVTAPTPSFADGGVAVGLQAIPTKFAGDTHTDLIVVYADSTYNKWGQPINPSGNAYAVQFLKGDGSGNFTDVTAQHLAVQPSIKDPTGTNEWVHDVQLANINGFDDIILYPFAGSPVILVNDGHDVYTQSSVSLPSDIQSATYGTTGAGTGFVGITSSMQWVFVPVDVARLQATEATVNAPLASQIYIYGPDHSGQATQAQTYDTSISLSIHSAYSPGTAHSFQLIVNGVNLGTASLPSSYGFTYQGQQYTNDQTFSFTVNGEPTITSLQLISDSPGSGEYVSDIAVNGIDLGAQDNWSGSTDSMSAAAWNSALAGRDIGTSVHPIQVTAGGGNSTVHLLGKPGEFTVSGIGTGLVTLSESSGLDQNAILKQVSFAAFTDGATLDLATGLWSVVDTSSQLAASLDDFEPLAAAGKLSHISVSDSPTPTLAITAVQSVADAAALGRISGPFALAISPGPGNQVLQGGPGVDTAIFADASSAHTLLKESTGWTLQGTGGNDVLTGVERLQFSDTSLALDLEGNAGVVAKILGAVFGPAAVSNKAYAGIGLSMADRGMSQDSLMQLAIDVKLGPEASHKAVVDLLYANVLGMAPSQADEALFTSWLDSGAWSVSALGLFAADTALNASNINLVGLSAKGLPYTPYVA